MLTKSQNKSNLGARRAEDGFLELAYDCDQGTYRSRISPEALSRSFVTKAAPRAVDHIVSHAPNLVVVSNDTATASWEIGADDGSRVTAVANLKRVEG